MPSGPPNDFWQAVSKLLCLQWRRQRSGRTEPPAGYAQAGVPTAKEAEFWADRVASR